MNGSPETSPTPSEYHPSPLRGGGSLGSLLGRPIHAELSHQNRLNTRAVFNSSNDSKQPIDQCFPNRGPTDL